MIENTDNDAAVGDTTATPAAEIEDAAVRLRDTLDTAAVGGRVSAGDRRLALAIAVEEVRRLALRTAVDDGDRAIGDALRRLVRGALHALGEDMLADLRTAALAGGRQRIVLRDMSREALRRGDLVTAIAADVMTAAGSRALYDAMVTSDGFGFVWHTDLQEIVRAQHCQTHDVFCCPACPDKPRVPMRHPRSSCADA